MVRILTRLGIAAAILSPAAFAETAEPSRVRWTAGLDLGYVSTSGYASWLEGSVGKLRYDDRSDGWIANRAYVDYRFRLTDTIDSKIVAEYYDDKAGSPLDLTQAYLEWRPLTLSANRYRFKLGAFYPRLSLENTGPAWSNRYTLNSSAINTWIAEEVKILGAELSASRRPASLGGTHRFSVQAAVFGSNDPAGSLLAWKGWSLHDRQSRAGDRLPLAALPQLQPGGVFDRQDPFVAPFREVDNRAGYYVSGEWQYGQRLMLRALHFDNRGDPRDIEDGQYAWGTKFSHVGAQLRLPADIGLLTQWMKGTTIMGRMIQGNYMVDVGFDSHFALLTRSFEHHRLSGRYDRFSVSESDATALDDNRESGHAWTLSYAYSATQHVTVAVEWLQIRTNRPAWRYAGLDPVNTEEQIQLSLKFRAGR